MGFQLILSLMTLNDLERHTSFILRFFHRIR